MTEKQSNIAVVTTFPGNMFEVHAKSALLSFWQCWPNEVPIYICLDEDKQSAEIAKWIIQERQSIPSNPTYVTNRYEPDHAKFVQDHQEHESAKDYRKQPVRFCHKVYAMDRAADDENIKYLIWYDADIITFNHITMDNLKAWLPEGKVVSYLGRKDWNVPETGFMIFDLESGGREFIRQMTAIYNSGEIMNYPEHTDAYVFAQVLAEWNKVNGRDVFEASPLGKFMAHYKGQRKFDVAKDFAVVPGDKIATTEPGVKNGYYGSKDNTTQMHGNRYDVQNINIQTRNCVDNSIICANVRANIHLIKNWVPICAENGEEVVICSAGPSLNPADIRPFYDRGVKVFAVKHALERLMEDGIVPYGCILLDPRSHVADFVKYPNRDVKYFVASMVDPTVTEHLLKNGCQVYGYHALVGAEEQNEIPPGAIGIVGGSATATRGISLLETMGFREMHLFGYDCCYLKKPDLQEKKENGRLKFEEVTLAVNTHGGKQDVRTVWTEGQFMAQFQEMMRIYLPNKNIKFHTYGYGLIPWLHNHMIKEQKWKDSLVEKLEADKKAIIASAPTIDEFTNNGGISKPCDKVG